MTLHLPRYPKEEFERRGDEIYDRYIRSRVETDKNKGKFVLIDIETGEWEMDADERQAANRLDSRIADAQVWMVRVGHDYVRRFGDGRTQKTA